MERSTRGFSQRIMEAIDRFRKPKEPLVRTKNWVQHGDLALWTAEEGEIVPYRSVRSLDEVGETLEKLGCANITKVQDGDKISSIEWTVDYNKCIGLGPGKISPRTLAFYLDENEALRYSCKVESQEFKSLEDGRVPNTLHFSGNAEETFSQVKGTYYFLFPFAQENHEVLAHTDTFNFQFMGTDDNNSDVRVRIGGVQFTFIPSVRSNSPLEGKVKIEVPDFEPKKFTS